MPRIPKKPVTIARFLRTVLGFLGLSRLRWRMAQAGEFFWWREAAPYLYPWKERLAKFGCTFGLQEATLSKSNSIHLDELKEQLGLKFDNEVPTGLEIGGGTSGLGYAIEDRVPVIVTDPLLDRYKRIEFYKKHVFEACQKDLCKCLGEYLPLTDKSVDLVLALNVLDHCYDPSMVLAEARRVLRPSGFVVVELELLSKGMLHRLLHPHKFDIEKLRCLVKRSGYQFHRISVAEMNGNVWTLSILRVTQASPG